MPHRNRKQKIDLVFTASWIFHFTVFTFSLFYTSVRLQMAFPWRSLWSLLVTEMSSVLSVISVSPLRSHALVSPSLGILFSAPFHIIPSAFHFHIKDIRLQIADVYASSPFHRSPDHSDKHAHIQALSHYHPCGQLSGCLWMKWSTSQPDCLLFSSAWQILIRLSLPYSAISTSGNLSDLFQVGIDVPSSGPLSKSLSLCVSPGMAEIQMFFPQHCHDLLEGKKLLLCLLWATGQGKAQMLAPHKFSEQMHLSVYCT